MKQIRNAIFLAIATLTAFAASADHWPTGFYKATGTDPAFYYNDEYRWYCGVQNPSQMTAFGGEAQVRVVGDVWSIINQGVNLNSCTWPDGFYKTSDADATYRLVPGNICLVSSPEMLAAYGVAPESVVVADSGSDFTSHRTNLGQCFWPDAN